MQIFSMCAHFDRTNQLHWFCCRWGRGFGLLQYFIDKDNPLNQPNSVLGIIFYTLQMALGKSFIIFQITVYSEELLPCSAVRIHFFLLWVSEHFIFNELILICRTVAVQKSCSVFGLLLLGVCGRLPLFGSDSCLCPGRLLYGVCVHICRQLRIAFHQPEAKESNYRNEGEVWIELSTNRRCA